MRLVVTENAMQALDEVPDRVEETFWSKIEDVERNLDLGAEPAAAFDKYLSGRMHPVLQMNLGRDYRAWFLEGVHLRGQDERAVYALTVLSKSDAEELSGTIQDAVSFFHAALERSQDP
ncbi:MAG: hypothetical protein SVU88_01955 [Candidatus Nanohaloarchaea archaeon]|nr:hypothetical protein [Candidatus Nanohaloarchaea archaeon]